MVGVRVAQCNGGVRMDRWTAAYYVCTAPTSYARFMLQSGAYNGVSKQW